MMEMKEKVLCAIGTIFMLGLLLLSSTLEYTLMIQ